MAEAARNVVCTGAMPIAITNCLNFGNPYDPEVYWQFSEAVLGIGEACRAFDTPVTGGNVSFYNESSSSAIYPTPVIGMIGLIENFEKTVPNYFTNEGEIIVILGNIGNDVGGSEYLFLQTGLVAGDAPKLDLQYEKRLQTLCLELISSQLITSAHDVSEGGLATALVEASIGGSRIIGSTLQNIDMKFSRSDFVLFGESQSRIVITTTLDNLNEVLTKAQQHEIDAKAVGETTTENRIKIANLIDLSLEEAKSEYELAIPRLMGEEVSNSI